MKPSPLEKVQEQELTRRYRKSQLEAVQKDSQYDRVIKVHNEFGETHWMAISPKEFKLLSKILLRKVI